MNIETPTPDAKSRHDELPPEFAIVKTLLEKQGSLECRVVSDSMEPFLKVEDRVRIEPLDDPFSLKQYDLIVFRDGSRLICHFFWCHNWVGPRPTITTRSLKNRLFDDLPTEFHDIFGKVTSHRLPRHLRWAISFSNFIRGTT